MNSDIGRGTMMSKWPRKQQDWKTESAVMKVAKNAKRDADRPQNRRLEMAPSPGLGGRQLQKSVSKSRLVVGLYGALRTFEWPAVHRSLFDFVSIIRNGTHGQNDMEPDYFLYVSLGDDGAKKQSARQFNVNATAANKSSVLGVLKKMNVKNVTLLDGSNRIAMENLTHYVPSWPKCFKRGFWAEDDANIIRSLNQFDKLRGLVNMIMLHEIHRRMRYEIVMLARPDFSYKLFLSRYERQAQYRSDFQHDLGNTTITWGDWCHVFSRSRLPDFLRPLDTFKNCKADARQHCCHYEKSETMFAKSMVGSVSRKYRLGRIIRDITKCEMPNKSFNCATPDSAYRLR